MKTKLNLNDIIILVAIASTTLYVVFRNLPIIIGSFRFFWAPIALGLIFFTRLDIFKRRSIKLLLLYGFVSLGILQYTLWSHMNEWNITRLINEFYAVLVFSCIWAYYWSKKEINKLAIISKWTFLFIVVTVIVTHLALFIDGGIVRESANNFRTSPELIKVYQNFGTAGYGYAQSLVLLIPALVYYIKTKNKIIFNHKVLFIILILIVLLILRANVFANLLVSIPIIILSFMGPKRGRASYGYIVLIVFLLILIPTSIYVDLIIAFSRYFPSDSIMHDKLLDFTVFLEFPELDSTTEAGGRAARYPLLLDAFIQRPFLGHASHDSSLDIITGGHLYWMNRLAIWGVFGFSFFVYVLYKFYKSIIAVFDDLFKYYYQLSVIAFVSLGLIKNIAGRELWLMLFVIIPGLYFLQKNQNKARNNQVERKNSNTSKVS